jgi:hypothetical protein
VYKNGSQSDRSERLCFFFPFKFGTVDAKRRSSIILLDNN